MASFSSNSMMQGGSGGSPGFGAPAGGMAGASNMMSFGGLASSAIGAYYQAGAQKRNAEYQAFTAATNARLAEKAAQSVLLQGEAEAGRVQLRGAQVGGAERAAGAANGVDISEGSSARVRASTQMITDMDVDTVQANALRSAWGYRAQSTNFQNQSTMAQASADMISPGAAFGSSLLGGAGSVASTWYRNSKGG